MNVQQTNLDVIANNIANVNTNGYKKSRADFQDLMYQTLRLQGARNEGGGMVPTGIQIGLGAMLLVGTEGLSAGRLSDGQTMNWTSPSKETGFFRSICLPGKRRIPGQGALKTDADGKIVTTDGYTIEPNLTIPAKTTSISIESDGTVTVQIQGQTCSAAARRP